MPDNTNKKYSSVLPPEVVANMNLQIAEFIEAKKQPDYKEYDPNFPQYIRRLTQLGFIPKELGQWFLTHEAPLYDEAYKKMKERGAEVMIISKSYQDENVIIGDMQKSEKLGEIISDSTCMEIIESENLNTHLFNNIDNSKDFGITKALMDRCFYLPELIENLKMTNTGVNSYILSAQLEGNGKGVGNIGLEYDFCASSPQEAEKIKEIYKKEMLSGAIKTFIACWAKANEVGSFFYSCRLNDIIEQTYTPGRKNRADQEERGNAWRHLKMLEHTKLTMIIPVKRNNKKRIEKISLGHRMIDLMAKSVEKDLRTPPETIYIKVLDAKEFYNSAFKATPIAKTTLKQRPEKLFLYLSIQAKQAQFEGRAIKFSEEDLIRNAGLSKTYSSNPRVARKRLRELLNRYVEECDYTKYILKNGVATLFPRCKTKKGN